MLILVIRFNVIQIYAAIISFKNEPSNIKISTKWWSGQSDRHRSCYSVYEQASKANKILGWMVKDIFTQLKINEQPITSVEN